MTEQTNNEADRRGRKGVGRAVGLALIAGAADDDCSAIGTYASAGARFGPDLLWTAPVTLPMMYTVVYLSSKLGQVSGRGLFQVIADFYPRWLLWSVLVGVLIGNAIEAAANLGAMSAAINLFVPLPVPMIVAFIAASMFALQVFGSYGLLRNLFRVLALALLAYVVSAVLAKPELSSVLGGTFLPKVHLNREYLSILVAIIGTTLSAYLYTWQSNQEVEEEIAKGRTTLEKRKGATEGELRRSRHDILIGMTFSNLIMYFIILSTGSTLHKVGQTQIETAAQAAEALRPLAGDAAGIFFAAGVIGVGFLAVPVMTTGAAFDLAQAMGWNHGMNAKPQKAPAFYLATGAFTLIAVVLNFLGFNPMHALVWAGVVQGFSTPPLLLLILLMTNDRRIMGDRVNSRSTNILGGITTTAIFAASAGLVVSWFL
ncbi:Nramp family divalent metal transporter [Mesorhizobium sp. B263B2A]|uniref:Nramp family divalent metal transporter n=1 Tax=Mesorhizobium sp. B263B2A TaxID=2876669 RepID=UPI001CD0BE7D|nr:Nramp family divalent metal transporter [Mesorhizobium sp. B263B2A]MCA0032113.1 Nramp family divalent metal transporter [Mesorhizobium sp. B263B2A]